MKIETRKIHDVLVVDMSGSLDSTSSGEAGDRIVNIAKGEHKRVLLNLAELEYVSSAGLRVILRGAKLLQGKRGELKICNAKGPVKDVLRTSGFNNLIRVYDTEQEAFSAFLSPVVTRTPHSGVPPPAPTPPPRLTHRGPSLASRPPERRVSPPNPYSAHCLGHGRGRLICYAVAAHPTADWPARQITDAFPS